MDFKKAFGSVWRAGLWSKLIRYNICGNFLNIIKNMYSSIKSCVKISGKCFELFVCSRTLRQGKNLSPLLFSLYLNDLEHFITTRNDKSIEIYDADLDILVKMLVLLYADDTVIFATSEENLVSVLNTFYSYCCQWKLDIYYDQTKVIVVCDFGQYTICNLNASNAL